jgi:hypothetical protein
MIIADAVAGTRVLIQPGRNSFPDMSSYISERFGFDLLQLRDYEIHRAQSEWAHLHGLGAAAYERYCRYFSLAAAGEALGRILEPSLAA